jgi:glycosyltransferase involved in cell wall biosynthesis
MAKVDIMVPCYNYGRFLEACISSLLEQSVRDIRILIIDDASTDGSVGIAERLARSDSRVRVRAHRQNRGHIATFNEGIEWAQSDYFLLLSADDLLAPGALERAVRVMDENPNIVLTYGNCAIWHEGDPFPVLNAVPGTLNWKRVDLVRKMCGTAINIVQTSTAIGRTDVQKAIGGYRPELTHTGDLEMWLRFGAYGEVAFINEVQGIYRKHDSAMSNAYWANILLDYRQRRLAFKLFFDATHGRAMAGLRAGTDRALADKAFQSGINAIRHGKIAGGIELLKWAMATDQRWRRVTSLWRIVKIPGPDGWRWALATLRDAVARLGGGRPIKSN